MILNSHKSWKVNALHSKSLHIQLWHYMWFDKKISQYSTIKQGSCSCRPPGECCWTVDIDMTIDRLGVGCCYWKIRTSRFWVVWYHINVSVCWAFWFFMRKWGKTHSSLKFLQLAILVFTLTWKLRYGYEAISFLWALLRNGKICHILPHDNNMFWKLKFQYCCTWLCWFILPLLCTY